MPERTYRHSTARDAGTVAARLADSWGQVRVVSHAVVYDLSTLPAPLAEESDDIVGILTYQLAAAALTAGRDRMWLTTTNDNLDALRFYQRRGFRFAALRPDAVSSARRLKPSIPLTGGYGIEIRDEIDLQMPLPGRDRPGRT